MHISTETPSPRQATPTSRLGGVESPTECDFCGRPVRRETSFPRVHRGYDGVEIVVLCRECELGTD